MLRNEYRRLRDQVVTALGFYTTGDFDNDVGVELRLRSLDQTPRGWVLAARHWYAQVMAEVAKYDDFLLERSREQNVGVG